MGLQPLQPGLPPDEVEKLRWESFGHKRATSIRSPEDLARFSNLRGFVLLHPRPGLHYPSAVEAAVGRPLLDHSWDERGRDVERWRIACVAARRLVSSAVLDESATLIAPGFLSDFYALSGNRGDLHDHERGRAAGVVGHEAAAICARLAAAGGPLSRSELEAALGMATVLGRERLRRALAEAVQRLLVVEVGGVTGEPDELRYDLLPRIFAEQVQKGTKTEARAARQRIACRYLRNVILGGCHELAPVLGWSESDTLAALMDLEKKGMVARHPSSRHNRHFFQATSTDLLPERTASGGGPRVSGRSSPARSAGSPASDASSPASDASSPASDASSPASDASSPASDASSAASNTDDPETRD